MSMIACCRSLVPVLALAAVLSAIPASGAPVTKTKPRLPVQIKIEAAQPGVTPDSIKPGDVVDLIVSAVSFADTDAMTITVVIPEGAVLISGDLYWTGPARKGEKKTLPITVRVPQKGTGEIKAEMSIRIEGSKAFSTSSRYTPGEAKKLKPEQKRPVKKDSKGENVIEYR